MARDWARWHEAYDDPASALSTRLALVRAHLSIALATAPAGPIRVVSLCAGQGHDVIGTLPGHPRRDDVSALLVERDPRNAGLARDREHVTEFDGRIAGADFLYLQHITRCDAVLLASGANDCVHKKSSSASASQPGASPNPEYSIVADTER